MKHHLRWQSRYFFKYQTLFSLFQFDFSRLQLVLCFPNSELSFTIPVSVIFRLSLSFCLFSAVGPVSVIFPLDKFQSFLCWSSFSHFLLVQFQSFFWFPNLRHFLCLPHFSHWLHTVSGSAEEETRRWARLSEKGSYGPENHESVSINTN